MHTSHPGRHLDSRMIFFLGLLLAASGMVSGPVALVGGIAFGFVFEHPLRRESAALARLLLQISVVLLGFGMDLHAVLRAGRTGFLSTAIGICFAIALGLLLGRLLSIPGKASFLITAGTAICGGSAIAAVAPILEASEEEIGISMGTVFLLNSIALILFPAVGAWAHLSQSQFGLWAALAIHDTSSVVGAAARYGSEALEVGTTVKLARALWIVPVSLLTAGWVRRRAAQPANPGAPGSIRSRIRPPWFILFFCLAALAASLAPRFRAAYVSLGHLGRLGLTATLFLIGTGLSRRMLRQIGLRPLVQGVLLWVAVAACSLAAVLLHWVAL